MAARNGFAMREQRLANRLGQRNLAWRIADRSVYAECRRSREASLRRPGLSGDLSCREPALQLRRHATTARSVLKRFSRDGL